MTSTQTDAPTGDAPTISFVSLGCPKALVDSERILTRLRAEGYEIARNHARRRRGDRQHLRLPRQRQGGIARGHRRGAQENGKVIVTGCMGAEPGPILEAYPNISAITGPQDYESVMAAVHKAAPPPQNPFLDLVPQQGIKLTPRHYAYLKISEGCHNRCTFCIIPKLRGDLVSRPAADVCARPKSWSRRASRNCWWFRRTPRAYGLDLRYASSRWHDREVRARFLDLARELGELGAWVRLHYVYPYPHVDEVIALMAEGKILPYLDIPFQHAAPNVLRAMKRPGNVEKMLDRIQAWRKICPDLAIRSTFIVGFPGETEEDFEILLDWLDEAKLDRVGAFKYEPVAGAAANDLGLPPVPAEVQQIRWRRFMEKQQKISSPARRPRWASACRSFSTRPFPAAPRAGQRPTRRKSTARFSSTSRRPLRAGDIVTVKIERAEAYDLHGAAVEKSLRGAKRHGNPEGAKLLVWTRSLLQRRRSLLVTTFKYYGSSTVATVVFRPSSARCASAASASG